MSHTSCDNISHNSSHTLLTHFSHTSHTTHGTHLICHTWLIAWRCVAVWPAAAVSLASAIAKRSGVLVFSPRHCVREVLVFCALPPPLLPFLHPPPLLPRISHTHSLQTLITQLLSHNSSQNTSSHNTRHTQLISHTSAAAVARGSTTCGGRAVSPLVFPLQVFFLLPVNFFCFRKDCSPFERFFFRVGQDFLHFKQKMFLPGSYEHG